MSKPRGYIYKPYPAMRYKSGEKPIIVHNKKDDDKLLADDWCKVPHEEVKAKVKAAGLEVSDESLDTISNGVATAANLVLRVPKCRSKKDLLNIAELLEIEIDKSLSLKAMRAEILEGAGQSEMIEG